MNRDFKHPGAHLTIGSTDSKTVLQVVAQYNPKELAFAKQVPWSQQTEDIGSGWAANGKLALNYGANQPRTLSLELVFDGYETNESVEDDVETLEELASPIEPESRDEELRRAHICVVVWGGGQRKFVCVIESLATKYTMFDTDGKPLRASCTVSLKEVNLRDMLECERAKNQVNGEAERKRLRNAS
jgi:hypothetical protein